MGSILFFSDIHADIGALDEILRLARGEDFIRRYGPVSKIVNLGDVMERGHNPGEVIDRLEGLGNVESILGNHDEAFLYRIPVSGSDAGSELAHDEYRETARFERFFRGMGKYYVDTANKLYAVHGGPIDPCAITPAGAAGVEAWLYSQPWQRVSEVGARYVDGSGYHYLPEDAFDSVRPALGDSGFAIICGHEHYEAVYREKGGAVEEVEGLHAETLAMSGREVREKKLPVGEDACYLIRLGIAGPEGYGEYVEDRCYFGVYSAPAHTFYMLSFIPERRGGPGKNALFRSPGSTC
jgi:hypothetical protein